MDIRGLGDANWKPDPCSQLIYGPTPDEQGGLMSIAEGWV